MRKIAAVFGAGSGLGLSVAQRFGREGYAVALIARTPSALEALSARLAADGIEAQCFPADLTATASVTSVMNQVVNELGPVDIIYYAPTTTEAFIPAAELTADAMRGPMELSFFSLVSTVRAALPAMLARGGGAIVAAFGGNAAQPAPYMSGVGVAHAATRNYLLSLRGEVAEHGVNVGLVCINGVITGSAYHRQVQAGESDAPETLEMPLVDAADAAEVLWSIAKGTGPTEVTLPA